MVDVTAHCKTIAKAVRDMCMGSRRQTLLYMSDVFKGANIQKIRTNNHQKAPCYGHLQSWQLTDIQRLFHKMVCDDYLREELIFCRDIPQAYLRLGTKIDQLMNGQVTIEFAVKIDDEKKSKKDTETVETVVKKVSGGTASVSTDADTMVTAPLILDDATATQISELKDRCHNDLLNVCRQLAAQRNVTMVSIMNMQALKSMAQKLPETEEQMLAIPHVTQANFVKFGKELLQITQQYAAEKLCTILFRMTIIWNDY